VHPISKILVWDKLLRLPLECWAKRILKGIIDECNKTLDVGISFKTNIKRIVEKNPVDIDIKEGLTKYIEIVMGSRMHR
jgi:hypothetical protein